jgi:hypothetical protein
METVLRIGIGPIIKQYAKSHFPTVKEEELGSLISEAAEYISNSFQDYQETLEEEALELIDQNQLPFPDEPPIFNKHALVAESCGLEDM